jgi:hypothetical protein
MTNNDNVNDKKFQRPLDMRVHLRPYGVGRPLQGLPAGLSGRTLLAGIVWPENGSG